MSPQILIVLILFTLIIISAAYLNQTASFKKEIVTPFSTLTPTSQATPEPQSSSPDNSGNTQGAQTSDLQYPNSSKTWTNSSVQTFISSDNPQVITNWYKNKIKSLGMNATSFVQTKTNGDVLNKLVGAGQGQRVEVEITKDNAQQEVTIKLHVNS